MTVAELIEELKKVKDKNLPIFAYCEYDACQGDSMKINFVDDGITDRVDINIG